MQRSALSKAAAVDRTARSVAAGLGAVAWFTDRTTSPQWVGHVPGYRTTVPAAAWQALPLPGTVTAAGLQAVESVQCGTRGPCPHRRRPCCLARCASPAQAAIAIQALRGRTPEMIWDIGCGVGRVVHDLAGVYPTATVVGLDNSAAMLSVAARILMDKDDFDIDLSDVGFDAARIRRSLVPCRENTLLVQVDAESIALRPLVARHGADLVLLINVLDRTEDPEQLLRTAMSAVAADGLIVIAVSGSWLSPELWRRYPDVLRFCLDFLTSGGFEVVFGMENLLLRELMNSRGAIDDYPISAIAACRPADDAQGRL